MTTRDTRATRTWLFGLIILLVLASLVYGLQVYARHHRRLSATAIRTDRRVDMRGPPAPSKPAP